MQTHLIFRGGIQAWYFNTDKFPTVTKDEDYSISIMARDYKGVQNHGMNIVVEVYEVTDEDR